MDVSIVIPLYNKQPYINRCLQSVLKQKYQHFEIIVVNDGSTDDGASEVEHFQDQRIRLLSQPNRGVAVARNVGVEAARNEMVFFLDADDTWQPELLQEVVKLIEIYPALGVYACGTTKIYANGQRQSETVAANAYEVNSFILRDYFQSFVDIGGSPFSSSSFCVRRTTFNLAGKYTAGVRLTEDSDLWVRLALISKFALLPRSLADYYVETADNTRTDPQTSPYEVIGTLEKLLASEKMPSHLRGSARKLLAMQKNTQIKRLILLGKTRAALRGFLTTVTWMLRPTETAVLLLAALMPQALFRRAYARKTSTR